MKTLFTLFTDYADADAAVAEMTDQGLRWQDMNAVVRADVATSAMDVSQRRANVEVTDEIGDGITAKGLDRILGGEQPVVLSDLGRVLAGGEEATMVVKSAQAEGRSRRNLVHVLEEFEVPESTGEAWTRGVERGGVLFWMQTEDEQASRAAELLRKHNGQQVGTYGA